MDGNIRKQWRDARNYGKFSVLIVVLEIIPGHGHRQPLKEGSVKHLFPSHILIPFKIPEVLTLIVAPVQSTSLIWSISRRAAWGGQGRVQTERATRLGPTPLLGCVGGVLWGSLG